eukprot:scpid85363/ scgid26202/ 
MLVATCLPSYVVELVGQLHSSAGSTVFLLWLTSCRWLSTTQRCSRCGCMRLALTSYVLCRSSVRGGASAAFLKEYIHAGVAFMPVCPPHSCVLSYRIARSMVKRGSTQVQCLQLQFIATSHFQTLDYFVNLLRAAIFYSAFYRLFFYCVETAH